MMDIFQESFFQLLLCHQSKAFLHSINVSRKQAPSKLEIESECKNAEELQRGWSLYLIDLRTLSSNRMVFGNYCSMIDEWFL